MRWLLLQQVMQKLVVVGELDPQRDATGLAERLLEIRPELFARLHGTAAPLAALAIARKVLPELCRLPELARAVEASIGSPYASPGSRFAQMVALAYLACEQDLIPDALPHGAGLVDDCIALYAAKVVPLIEFGRLGERLTDAMLPVRWLSLAVPTDALPGLEALLRQIAELALHADQVPSSLIGLALQTLLEQPPEQLRGPLEIELPDRAPLPEALVKAFSLPLGQVVEADELVIEFADGGLLR